MTTTRPASDLMLVQSRLMSPAYAGPARWLVFKASTRRTFAAIGPDVVPDVLRALNGWPDGTEEPAQREERLLELGLLEPQEPGLPAEERPCPSSRNITSLFQRASFNYPFHDYADPAALKDYHQLIKSFLSMGPPPPNQVAFEGKTFPLTSTPLLGPAPQGGLDLDSISFLLEHAFRPIGTLHTDSLDCIRRTSPSGGARHPTEPLLVFREAMAGIPPGIYFYRSEDHALVEAPPSTYGLNTWKAEAPVSLVLWLKVERAMWRYRDLRALRPVLMDVGHIVETVSLLAGRMGLKGLASAQPPVCQPLSAWLDGPPVLSIHLFGQAPAPCLPRKEKAQPLTPEEPSSGFLTNPSFLMTFLGPKLTGRALWPTTHSVEMDQTDFGIVNHCLPSRRGDRKTTPPDILAAVPAATRDRINRLVRAGVLLPREVVEDFLGGVRLWSRYGWYLSFLAHLEAVAEWQTNPPEGQAIGLAADYIGSLAALQERRTIRSFSAQPIGQDKALDLMARVVDRAQPAAPDSLEVYLAPTRVTGLVPGLYRWQGGILQPLGLPPEPFQTPQGISSLVIGQSSAGAGALCVWMIARSDTDNGAAYQDLLIRMGRLGQRLCLAATELGLGVFLTPAISDAKVAEMLRIQEPSKTIGYFFSLGLPSDHPYEA